MAKTRKLELSAAADRDLEAIYKYGFEHWGEAQADAYFAGLIRHFDKLCENPLLYAPIDDIRAGYRRSVCGVHSVYYRVTDGTVQIMAIIGRQDFRGRFESEDY
ncbi:MAG: type II toxin-antitoxin system RelE/ParE family toxin [Hoeflea sp.]|uniref:type II toxin-antitoxin system RelE/ParE family toxin n=1 Tax=Hoeflea sp. TaxID=1940281 RepID=UPI001D3CCE94|nr:type II toxin-antitoxin system RelE/ParE family toxin [Hoeflea sp.]MBU4529692.1 type II toxin-antitoxin system RelE/ParE family toxin [Alphaproteobacteria bacterium]MBU4546811.1 type II toxin-antitoxin system RelE/ParE family toxin [Alphaproteobacteria bacterium]MBU4551079.1 type II toxin-antitoxin system RelE/ParE family toxin [Alphaproteobacteria bacterium]MBV1724021.1 type II toxin-antitoxin system RelE/ParE family toxin [Hoeflea sp.]MBV1763298.1 type II toxin-antitoxin system RelE/ParE 